MTEFPFVVHYVPFGESGIADETKAAFEVLREGELLPQLWTCRSCGSEYLLQDLPIGYDAFLGLPVCSHCPTWGWDRVRPVEQSV